MDMPSTNRRAFLGASTVLGLSTLAGFKSLQTANAENKPTTSENGNDSLDSWLATANDPHTPQIRDFRFDDPPSVYLNISNSKSFSPPAIKVEPGTTVTWEWTGNGDEHNVVATDETFDSGAPDGEAGTTFEYTFETEGVYQYVSEPQADAGMKGVVVVESAPSSGYPSVDEWLVDTNEYDGSITDRTDEDLVEITNGAEGNGGNFAFDPHAVKVSTETTIRWSWTGSGGAHNVVFDDADIGGEMIKAEPGVQFDYTFNETGVFRYACQPHHALGHRGAIIVE